MGPSNGSRIEASPTCRLYRRHYLLPSASNVADLQVNLVHKDERDDQSHAIAVRVRARTIESPVYAILDMAERVRQIELPAGPPSRRP